MEPVFSIKLSETELSLLYAIKEYLINNLDLDIYSVNKLEGSSVKSLIPLRGIGKGKAVNNSKPLATLTIKNVHFLNNVFIPFFDESQFISKKGLDFKDFKLICHTIYMGGHCMVVALKNKIRNGFVLVGMRKWGNIGNIMLNSFEEHVVIKPVYYACDIIYLSIKDRIN